MKVLVAGDGAVARAFAAALPAAGVAVARWRRGDPAGERCDAAIVAVADRAIGEVAARLTDGGALDERSVALHCAGGVPAAEAFAGVRRRIGGVGLLHPLRAFAGAPEDAELAGTVFGVEGDARGRAVAAELATRLGGRPVPLTADGLARWHAAAVLAGNHTLALVDAAIALAAGEGLDRAEAARALAGLLASAARNVAAVGLPAALTGPIARGDVATVRRHLAALPEEARALYRASARPTVELARAKGRAEPSALDAIAALIADKGD